MYDIPQVTCGTAGVPSMVVKGTGARMERLLGQVTKGLCVTGYDVHSKITSQDYDNKTKIFNFSRESNL